MFFFFTFKPVVPKKPKRSVPVSSSVDRDRSQRDGSRVSVAPLSREASDVMPTPTVRKTDVRTETQPNGSEVTTTIVEFTDQVRFTFLRNASENVPLCICVFAVLNKQESHARLICCRITVSLA